MTLDEMLALLPDNSTGAIDASDLRAIVSDLYAAAHTQGQVFGYLWVASGGAPAAGKVTVTPSWSVDSDTLRINETTDDGQNLTFAIIDSNPTSVVLYGANGGVLHADITGPSVDQGSSRDLPITVRDVTGPVPVNSEKMSVAIQVVVP